MAPTATAAEEQKQAAAGDDGQQLSGVAAQHPGTRRVHDSSEKDPFPCQQPEVEG